MKARTLLLTGVLLLLTGCTAPHVIRGTVVAKAYTAPRYIAARYVPGVPAHSTAAYCLIGSKRVTSDNSARCLQLEGSFVPARIIKAVPARVIPAHYTAPSWRVQLRVCSGGICGLTWRPVTEALWNRAQAGAVLVVPA